MARPGPPTCPTAASPPSMPTAEQQAPAAQPSGRRGLPSRPQRQGSAARRSGSSTSVGAQSSGPLTGLQRAGAPRGSSPRSRRSDVVGLRVVGADELGSAGERRIAAGRAVGPWPRWCRRRRGCAPGSRARPGSDRGSPCPAGRCASRRRRRIARRCAGEHARGRRARLSGPVVAPDAVLVVEREEHLARRPRGWASPPRAPPPPTVELAPDVVGREQPSVPKTERISASRASSSAGPIGTGPRSRGRAGRAWVVLGLDEDHDGRWPGWATDQRPTSRDRRPA